MRSLPHRSVFHGVPQGPLLRPLLFIYCMFPLGTIIRQHDINLHCSVGDTCLYLSIKPDETCEVAAFKDDGTVRSSTIMNELTHFVDNYDEVSSVCLDKHVPYRHTYRQLCIHCSKIKGHTVLLASSMIE